MGSDLSLKSSRTLFEGEGGSYYSWSSSDLPMLKEANVGAGKLVLKPLGFALPHYADSTKVGYVLEGKGVAGLVHPQNPKEKVVRLQSGDFVQVPVGHVSWWYNDSESDLTIIFLGDTSSALNPGEFTYFFLTGSAGIFTGFSTEFITKSLKIEAAAAKKLFRSQPGFLIVKPQGRLDFEAKSVEQQSVNGLFSADIVKLEPGDVKEGDLVVVPKFAVVSVIAGGEGIEWFSITMSPRPVFGFLTGKESILEALSPQVLGASLNVDQCLLKILSSNAEN
ncbi:glycinin G1-like [Asparagus officinalis]|uniref:glycinin G1-like n=1 Tax=Asparagus officinalis TaxID=4686 RepID=UPI00098E21C9|nr:glycinin G1-like [Asparagus officinalis]